MQMLRLIHQLWRWGSACAWIRVLGWFISKPRPLSPHDSISSPTIKLLLKLAQLSLLLILILCSRCPLFQSRSLEDLWISQPCRSHGISIAASAQRVRPAMRSPSLDPTALNGGPVFCVLHLRSFYRKLSNDHGGGGLTVIFSSPKSHTFCSLTHCKHCRCSQWILHPLSPQEELWLHLMQKPSQERMFLKTWVMLPDVTWISRFLALNITILNVTIFIFCTLHTVMYFSHINR